MKRDEFAGLGTQLRVKQEERIQPNHDKMALKGRRRKSKKDINYAPKLRDRSGSKMKRERSFRQSQNQHANLIDRIRNGDERRADLKGPRYDTSNWSTGKKKRIAYSQRRREQK